MTMSEDDRIAYLAGDAVESLTARERAELDEVRALLEDPALWAKPDPALEERVVAAIAEEAQARSASERVRRPAFHRRLVPRRRLHAIAGSAAAVPRRPLYAIAGVAAAAAVALVVALAANNPAPKAQQFAMVISGTGLAPGAHGSATLTKTSSGWRIELSATRLPRLSDGRYYEAWLKSSAGVLVPVGTFNEARHVTLWAGVPPTGFPTLTVTQQKADGNPASSGRRVLTGTIRPAH
jgi:Anti-sigma-K factor rskA, C-terminal